MKKGTGMSFYLSLPVNEILVGDAVKKLQELPDRSVNCCVTSPPYYKLRDYGMPGQIGWEKIPEEYIEKLVLVFREIRRVLTDEGTLWIVIGDSYNGSGKNRISGGKAYSGSGKYKQGTNKGSIIGNIYKTDVDYLKPKDLIGIPWMLAFALRADGWYLRKDNIWSKPNPMPESVKDRCTTSHEYIFMFSKSRKYYYDYESIMEEAKYDGRKDTRMKGSHKYSQNGVTGLTPQTFAARGHERWVMKDGRYMKNKRSVWTVATKPYKDAHYAVYPPELVRDCILAGCPVDGIVIDPFFGSGTTGEVCAENNRNWIGIDLDPRNEVLAKKRLSNNV